MHHKHHNQNPHHQKPNNNIPTGPSPGGASFQKKKGFLANVREKFREKDVTQEEVDQLGLKAKKETFKSQIAAAKHNRPSKIGSLLYGGPPQRGGGGNRSYGRSAPRQEDTSSFLFGGNSGSGGGMLDSGSGFGNGLNDMLGAGSSGKQPRGHKKVKSGFEDMFM